MKRSQKSGFTLVEVIVVGILMTFLVAMILPLAWDAVGQPSIDMMIDCRMGQEAQLTAMSLAADCGGCLPRKRAEISGVKCEARFAGAAIGEDETTLILSYDATPAVVVTYAVDADEHTLVRAQGEVSVVVAENVYYMHLDDTELDDRIKVTLTFSFRDPDSTGIPDKYRRPYRYIFYVPKGVAS
ncbi:MAG TPA: hypothetical protein DD670_01830 [Planctomycetaceae bacterium]|nr:hypothetical protein [Planctomycetaceae bacterium]